MGALKVPGPEGYPASFFQQMWQIVGQYVVSLVKCFFRHIFPLYRINQTFIVLTPKKSIPQNVNNLRPISLCNVIYKRDFYEKIKVKS